MRREISPAQAPITLPASLKILQEGFSKHYNTVVILCTHPPMHQSLPNSSFFWPYLLCFRLEARWLNPEMDTSAQHPLSHLSLSPVDCVAWASHLAKKSLDSPSLNGNTRLQDTLAFLISRGTLSQGFTPEP